jgi:multiple sugar transport system permease protein
MGVITRREQSVGWGLIAPALALLGLVFVYPIGRALWQSLFFQNLGTEMQPIFAGVTNYQRMMGDGRFWQSLTNSVQFTIISVTLELLLGLAIALLLHRRFWGRGAVRTIALLPWALPTALMALAWTWIFNDEFGLINDVLLRLGLIKTGINWLGDPNLAMGAIVVADVWKTTPFVSMLLLAGLQSIPADLYEAHAIDGATPWQSFRMITLPLLLPQLLIAALFRVAQAFGVFDIVSVMTGGGPAGTTEMVSLYIYANIMRYLDFGYGSALVMVTFLALLVSIWVASLLLTQLRKTQESA